MALLSVLQPAAVQAAREAEAQATVQRDEAREAMIRDLQAARYAADRAFRQYDAADPENRFVAGELEARWNCALTRVVEFERRIADHDAAAQPRSDLASISFTELAEDFRTVWSAPTTDARLKKRIVRTVIHEAMADPAAARLAAPAQTSGRSRTCVADRAATTRTDRFAVGVGPWWQKLHNTGDVRCDEQLYNEAHSSQRSMLIRDIIAKMRHDGCGGMAEKVELLSGIEGVSSRPVRKIVLIDR